MKETTGSEQSPPPATWCEQFRDDAEIRMYMYIAGLIRTLRSNTLMAIMAKAKYEALIDTPLGSRYTFSDAMMFVSAVTRDLPTEEWPNKEAMVRAYPAIKELTPLAPSLHKPPELDMRIRAVGKGERWALEKLWHSFNESFAPGIRW